MKSFSTLLVVIVIISLSIKTLGAMLISIPDKRYRGDDLGFE